MVAERAMQEPAAPGLACFLAQQAAEKSLKGVAAHLGARRIPRTHNLPAVAALARSLGASLPFGDERLARLDPYAVAPRYPDAPEPSQARAKRALALAREVYSWAEGSVSAGPDGRAGQG